nr:hypothetical protein [Streptomyces spongiae]
MQADTGCGHGERGAQGGQDGQGRGAGRGYAEGAVRGRGIERRWCDHLVRRGLQNQVDRSGQRIGARGEHVVAADPDEEFVTEGAPQSLQGVAHGRLGQPDRVGGAGDTAVLEEGGEQWEQIEVDPVQASCGVRRSSVVVHSGYSPRLCIACEILIRLIAGCGITVLIDPGRHCLHRSGVLGHRSRLRIGFA